MKNLKKYSAFVAAMCVLLSIMLLACACAVDGADANATEGATKETTAIKTTAATTDEPIITRPAKTTEPAPTKVTYTVKVVGPDGEAVQGVLIGICDDSGCRMPGSTNAEGIVSFTYPESNFHAQIQPNGIPAGYTATTDQYDFPAGETTLTITLAKAN